jgi:cysteine desulfuration protein SufE
MTISEIENEIIEEFSLFDDWMEKYEHIIELGRDLPIIEEKFKLEENLIKGCQSRVWLNAEVKNGEISYTADSDAIITKGIIALLVRVLNNQDAKEIVEAKLAFIDEIGLKEHLSPTRSNGLVSMIKQMKVYALLMQAS